MSWNLSMLGGFAAFFGLIPAGLWLKMSAQAENAPPAGKPALANRGLDLWSGSHLDATELEPERDEYVMPYKFNPVDHEWQLNACSTLGIRFVRSNTVRPGGPRVPLKAPTTIRRIGDDGNCLFRSLALIITGSEDQHLAIRQRILRHMCKIAHFLLGIHIPDRYRSVEEYIRHTGMHRVSTWGTEVEIFTMAHLLNTTIFSFNSRDKRWWRFSPNFVDLSLPDDCTAMAIYLNHTPSHFEVVHSIA